jgi:hypothetical protein
MTVRSYTFIQDETTRAYLLNADWAITQLELWDWVKNTNPEKGFMFESTEMTQKIMSKMCEQPIGCCHSGGSYGITMRHIEYIAIYGYDKYIEYYMST